MKQVNSSLLKSYSLFTVMEPRLSFNISKYISTISALNFKIVAVFLPCITFFLSIYRFEALPDKSLI